MAKKVLIIGQQGQLSRQLVASCPVGVQYFCMGRHQQPETMFASFRPDHVINTAAFTAVDAAETERDAAFAVNVHLVQKLQALCQAAAIPLLHISTDFVFEGNKGSAYVEQDTPAAINYYGQTKWLAEQHLLQHYADQSLIIRTSWLYSCYGDNFVLKVLKLIQSGTVSALSMPQQQQGSPTFALGLAHVIWSLVLKGRNSGLYHWADVGTASRIEFTQAIVQFAFELGLINKLLPVEALSVDLVTAGAKRPFNSTLDSSLLRSELTGLPDAVDWKSQLRLMLEHYKMSKGG